MLRRRHRATASLALTGRRRRADERFFVEAGRTPEGPGLPPPGPPDVARLREIAPRFGNEIVGPPLARERA